MTQINRRKKLMIKKQFQMNFIFKFCLIVLLSSLLFGILLLLLSSDSTTVVFKNLRIESLPTYRYLLPSLTVGLIVSMVIASILTIVLSLIISHRLMGPLYRFEKVLKEMASGNLNQSVQIRTHDQCKELADCFNQTLTELRKKMMEIENSLKALEEEPEKATSNDKIKDVYRAIEQFHYK